MYVLNKVPARHYAYSPQTRHLLYLLFAIDVTVLLLKMNFSRYDIRWIDRIQLIHSLALHSSVSCEFTARKNCLMTEGRRPEVIKQFLRAVNSHDTLL